MINFIAGVIFGVIICTIGLTRSAEIIDSAVQRAQTVILDHAK